jgi:hypothetical protein
MITLPVGKQTAGTGDRADIVTWGVGRRLCPEVVASVQGGILSMMRLGLKAGSTGMPRRPSALRDRVSHTIPVGAPVSRGTSRDRRTSLERRGARIRRPRVISWSLTSSLQIAVGRRHPARVGNTVSATMRTSLPPNRIAQSVSVNREGSDTGDRPRPALSTDGRLRRTASIPDTAAATPALTAI